MRMRAHEKERHERSSLRRSCESLARYLYSSPVSTLHLGR